MTNGKVALVTGASRGIGRACAIKLGEAGYKVAVNYNSNEAAANEVVEKIKAAGSEAVAIKANVSDLAQVKTMMREVINAFGQLDVLVNNAGIYPAVSLLEMTEEDFDRVFRVNVRGAFEMAREAAKQSMIPCNGGKLIFVSSVDGWLPSAGIAAYAASKAAVNSLVKSFAIELSPYGIHANGIAPGWVATETVLKAGRWKTQMDSVLEKRMADPEEIGKAIIALCKDSFDYMDGEVLNFSGGLIMNA